eukprot:TRINITY_DN107627_c0_g1_i1.p1 TRINITY_DN107627_c0_g1~~TRINITY_DN107627_c0_g1_i1.p1  ORF type:complete len:658 (+),score=96.75 TRINITY_DN107627_c0_g1_i1:120-2093(+)
MTSKVKPLSDLDKSDADNGDLVAMLAEAEEAVAGGLEVKQMKVMQWSKRYRIAALRSAFLCLVVTILIVVQIILLLVDVGVEDTARQSQSQIVIENLCEVSEWNASAWPTKTSIRDAAFHRIRFLPQLNATLTSNFSDTLPELEFLDSDGWRRPSFDSLHLMLSFGLLHFPVLEQTVEVKIPASCTGRALVDLWAANVQTTLVAAGRRHLALPPDKGLPLHRSFGGILLRRDSDTIFGPTKHTFTEDKFYYSPASQWMQAACIVLLCLLSSNVVIVGGRAAFEDWQAGVQEWIVEYEYLWKYPKVRKTILKKDFMVGMQVLVPFPDEMGRDAIDSAPHRRRATVVGIDVLREISCEMLPRGSGNIVKIPWDQKEELVRNKKERASCEIDVSDIPSLLEACSPLFILDHVIGDVVKNCEEVRPAISSACIQGLILGLVPILIWSAAFFSEGHLAIPMIIVLVCHWFAVVTFGSLYHFYVSWSVRRPFLLLLQGTLTFCVIATVTFLISVVLFILQMLVADPDQVISVALFLGTLISYPVIVLAQLRECKKLYDKTVKTDISKRGVIAQGWTHLHVSTRWIYITVVFGLIELLLLALFLLLTGSIFRGPVGIDQLLPQVILPFTGMAKAVQQVQGKKKEIDTEAKSVQKQMAGVASKML